MKNTNENPREIIPLEAHPSRLIRHVDERLMSYNIEMTEVTGGTFWKAYTAEQIAGTAEFPAVTAFTDVTAMPELMEYYPPTTTNMVPLGTISPCIAAFWFGVIQQAIRQLVK